MERRKGDDQATLMVEERRERVYTRVPSAKSRQRFSDGHSFRLSSWTAKKRNTSTEAVITISKHKRISIHYRFIIALLNCRSLLCIAHTAAVKSRDASSRAFEIPRRVLGACSCELLACELVNLLS
jgi:hypothetical protein